MYILEAEYVIKHVVRRRYSRILSHDQAEICMMFGAQKQNPS